MEHINLLWILIELSANAVTGYGNSFGLFSLTSDVVVLSFEERFIEGKLQDTSSVFYKIHQTLAKTPGALSEDEVI